MNKKLYVVIIAIIFLIAALVSYFNETQIEKEENENKTENNVTTTTESDKENEKDEEEDIMDGITLNYQSSIRIEKKGMIIYFDPFKITEAKNDADYVFITHSHYDHYSEEDIKKVMNSDTNFIVTNDLESKIKKLGVSDDKITVVYPNENHTVMDLSFEVIPAYNTDKTYHKKSYNWVGYNVDIDGIKYYVVGDSDVTDELKKVNCDVIFIPVGGTYTMTDSEASSVVNEMKPKYAVPVHYDEVGSSVNANNFTDGLNENIKGIILK